MFCGDTRVFLDAEIRRVDCGRCGKVKQERLAFLADNPFYTKRFAFYVGRRCRSSTIKDVAQELHLDWHTVMELEKQYMAEQVRRAGNPAPKVIGIDEVSIRKRHTYRIVVTDLVRERPIRFGGTDRSEASMKESLSVSSGTTPREDWARRFFENWRDSLKWQRLKPYEQFAKMIDRHWDGIAAHCRTETKVALGFVEGLNNKVRVIQRRAYGLRDEEYLRLKILTCMLPALCPRAYHGSL